MIFTFLPATITETIDSVEEATPIVNFPNEYLTWVGPLLGFATVALVVALMFILWNETSEKKYTSAKIFIAPFAVLGAVGLLFIGITQANDNSHIAASENVNVAVQEKYGISLVESVINQGQTEIAPGKHLAVDQSGGHALVNLKLINDRTDVVVILNDTEFTTLGKLAEQQAEQQLADAIENGEATGGPTGG